MSAAIRDTLHWLSFPQRITYKLCLMTYKCLHGLASEYQSRYCVPLASVPGLVAVNFHGLASEYLSPYCVPLASVPGLVAVNFHGLVSAYQSRYCVPLASVPGLVAVNYVLLTPTSCLLLKHIHSWAMIILGF